MITLVKNQPLPRGLSGRAQAVLASRCRRLGGRTVAQCCGAIFTLFAAGVIVGGLAQLTTATTVEWVWLEAPEPVTAGSLEDALRREFGSRLARDERPAEQPLAEQSSPR